MTLILFMATLLIAPIAEAVSSFDERTPIGSILRTAEWAQMPQELRRRALWSAGVESARVMNRVQSGIQSILGHIREEGGVIADRSKVIADIMGLAAKEGLQPSDPKLRGTIQDITSERRAELIVDTQTEMAYGFANWKAGQDEDALDAYPAQELIRIEDRVHPRAWLRRWTQAGGKLFGGRMIALKTDPVWEKISRFQNPWPPFDFNSGMGVEDVSRAEAVEFGLIKPGESVPPIDAQLNQKLETTVRDLSPELRLGLQSLFGEQIAVDGDTVHWKGNIDLYEREANDQRESARRVFTRSSETLGTLRPGDDGITLPPEVARTNASEISAVASGRKALFHEQIEGLATAESARRIQESLPQGIIARAENGHLYVYNPTLAESFLDGSKPLFPQIRDLTQRGENGLLLGYGQKTLFAQDSVQVLIFGPDDRPIAGFRTKRKQARLYGAARARDYADATGQPHTYEIILSGGAA